MSNDNGQAARVVDVGEGEQLALEALARQTVPDRLARLERREMLEHPAALGRLLAEVARVRVEQSELVREVRALREERRRDNTAARRAARMIATAIVWAAVTLGAPQLAGPLGGAARPAPMPPAGAP